jgi:hypothetical protein
LNRSKSPVEQFPPPIVFITRRPKIERYWKLSAAISDRLAPDGIKAAIEDLQAQNAALHPEQKQP